jgi:hypothetical protein
MCTSLLFSLWNSLRSVYVLYYFPSARLFNQRMPWGAKCSIVSRALFDLLSAVPADIKARAKKVAFDGTSGTTVLVDRLSGDILAPAKLYNEVQLCNSWAVRDPAVWLALSRGRWGILTGNNKCMLSTSL